PILNYALIVDEHRDKIPYTYTLRKNLDAYHDLNSIQLALLENYAAKLNEVEKDWEKNRGSKFTQNKNAANAMGILGRLNYGNGLFSQHYYNYMVVYNENGARIRSAVVERENVIVDYTSYYAYFDDKNEAYYICGILNSNYLINKLVASGILSERHIEKKPFEMSILKYDKENITHVKIAELSIELSSLSKDNEEFGNKYKELDECAEKCLTKQ
ncbi:hypothetical protein, partial [Metallibacterium scheffleri]|uniref:hypothetical protein n=1 Tax=Metallibacterium scheffleri TaxID=993689 RepID=UPI0023F25E41